MIEVALIWLSLMTPSSLIYLGEFKTIDECLLADQELQAIIPEDWLPMCNVHFEFKELPDE